MEFLKDQTILKMLSEELNLKFHHLEKPEGFEKSDDYGGIYHVVTQGKGTFSNIINIFKYKDIGKRWLKSVYTFFIDTGTPSRNSPKKKRLSNQLLSLIRTKLNIEECEYRPVYKFIVEELN